MLFESFRHALWHGFTEFHCLCCSNCSMTACTNMHCMFHQTATVESHQQTLSEVCELYLTLILPSEVENNGGTGHGLSCSWQRSSATDFVHCHTTFVATRRTLHGMYWMTDCHTELWAAGSPYSVKNIWERKNTPATRCKCPPITPGGPWMRHNGFDNAFRTA